MSEWEIRHRSGAEVGHVRLAKLTPAGGERMSRSPRRARALIDSPDGTPAAARPPARIDAGPPPGAMAKSAEPEESTSSHSGWGGEASVSGA